mmetsp:Transcript_94506/g.271034  ORF Transcript_94506/g.271034 Transcript_94506/m.271034 type:complete len:200 (+) Transcript_94506:221-820(+)
MRGQCLGGRQRRLLRCAPWSSGGSPVAQAKAPAPMCRCCRRGRRSARARALLASSTTAASPGARARWATAPPARRRCRRRRAPLPARRRRAAGRWPTQATRSSWRPEPRWRWSGTAGRPSPPHPAAASVGGAHRCPSRCSRRRRPPCRRFPSSSPKRKRRRRHKGEAAWADWAAAPPAAPEGSPRAAKGCKKARVRPSL